MIKLTTMNKTLLIFLTCLPMCLSAQQMESQESFPIITFLNRTIDYDTIERYSNGHRTFTFYNTGTAPLIVSRVKSGCSCTVASFTKDTLLPGERGQISAKYNTKKPGKFERELVVYSNAKDHSLTKIWIKGYVLDTKLHYGIEKNK
jgi:hypothetical protein